MSNSISMSKDDSGAVPLITFSGSMDEHSDYSGLDLSSLTEVQFDLSSIDKINSTGIQSWVEFMRKVPNDCKINLINCNSRVIIQINQFSDFMAETQYEVQSFQAPYFCEKCDDVVNVILSPSEVDTSSGSAKAPAKKCPNCDGAVEFDGVEKKYFMFVKETG